MNTKNQVETKTKTHTTSESASFYDVAVGLISVLIRRQDLKPVETGQNNAKYYDAGVLKQLRLRYAKSEPECDEADNTQGLKTQSTVAQSENQLLRDQLESVKPTIEILRNESKIENSQINKLQDLTNQA